MLEKGDDIVCPEDGLSAGTEAQSITAFPVNVTFLDFLDQKQRPICKKISLSINNSISSDSKGRLLSETAKQDESCSDFQMYRSSDEKILPELTPVEHVSRTTNKTKNSDSANNFCAIHQKKKKTVCLEDECQVMICSHCGLYGAHRVKSSDAQCY